MKFLKNNQGFSLVEILIYISVFAIVSVVVINSYIVIMNSFAQTRSNRNLAESGNNVMERISREIRQAETIDLVNSSFGASPGVLQLNSTDIYDNTNIVKFILANGDLNLYQNDVLTGSLLKPEISVTNLIFRRISTVGTQEAVKIEMTFQDNKSLKTENFYDTIILRGGY